MPETAVPVREQDDGNYHVHEYYWEHHDSWTSWLRASGTWYWRTSRSWTRWLRASLREHTGSLHEHDEGKHHVHEHDHCEHHEHEHPVHDKITEYITDMNNTMDDIMNLMIEHISYMNIF